MKYTTPLTIVASALAAFAISSCGSSDPDYKEWKKQQGGTADNPYGAPAAAAANPYGTPQDGGETGSYTAEGGAAPYQTLPGIPEAGATAPYTPAPSAVPAAGEGVSHTVVSGDSLWGLARKYNTTIEAIQSANGITDSNIRTGQTLTIPAR